LVLFLAAHAADAHMRVEGGGKHMTTRRMVTGGLAAMGLSGKARAQPAIDPALVGDWGGKLEIGAGRALRLKLSINATGAAQLFSLDQGGAPIAVIVQNATPTKLEFTAPSVRGRFVGARTIGLWAHGPRARHFR
jgi:hypothetical protein